MAHGELVRQLLATYSNREPPPPSKIGQAQTRHFACSPQPVGFPFHSHPGALGSHFMKREIRRRRKHDGTKMWGGKYCHSWAGGICEGERDDGDCAGCNLRRTRLGRRANTGMCGPVPQESKATARGTPRNLALHRKKKKNVGVHGRTVRTRRRRTGAHTHRMARLAVPIRARGACV